MGRHKKRNRKRSPKLSGKTIGRFQLMGGNIELVDDDGRLHLFGLTPDGEPPCKLFSTPGNSRAECNMLMHMAIDTLSCGVDAAAEVFHRLISEEHQPHSPETVRASARSTFGPFARSTAPLAPIKPEEAN